ncbi:hypothetical protein ACWFRB_11800 [Rhodococcus sp. NPDC055112]
MSSLTKFARPAAILAIGAAAAVGVPGLASAAPFTWNSGNDGGSAAGVTVNGAGKFDYTLDNPTGFAVANMQVSTFQFLGSAGPFVPGGPVTLAPGATTGGTEDGITVHVINGGTYDPDSTDLVAANEVGTGYAVTW